MDIKSQKRSFYISESWRAEFSYFLSDGERFKHRVYGIQVLNERHIITKLFLKFYKANDT